MTKAERIAELERQVEVLSTRLAWLESQPRTLTYPVVLPATPNRWSPPPFGGPWVTNGTQEPLPPLPRITS